MIDGISPDVVVFAGDNIYDSGSTGNVDDIKEFITVLSYLESKERYAIIIEGNHDNTYDNYYKILKKIQNSQYIFELSLKQKVIQGVHFWGVPYGAERQEAELTKQNIDIVIAHPEYSNRTWLLDINTQFVVCGHFDNCLTDIQGQALVSLNCSPFSYAVIDWQNGYQKITYCYRRMGKSCNIQLLRKEGHFCQIVYDNSKVARQLLEGAEDLPYSRMIEELRKAKKEIKTLDQTGQIELLNHLIKLGIPKTHIERYIGKKRLLYRYKQ